MGVRKYNLISCIFFAVIILFLALFLNTGVCKAEPLNTLRLSGSDRYETAIAISNQGWTESKYAVLARGDDFPDALCAAPLAKKYGAPILLTEPNRLNPGVLKELKRLGTLNVIITGGTGAVSKAVEKALTDAGISVERLGGGDRYETSVEIAQKVGVGREIVLATGNNFPDALSISAIAAKLGMPILLTEQNRLPYSVWQYMEDNGQINRTYVIGGKGVINDAVMEAVTGGKRLGGNNRYETNVIVMKEFSSKFNFNNIFVSVADGPYGDEFADALSGSVLAAKSSSPVMLVYKNLAAVTDYFIKPILTGETKVTVLGGESVVPSSLVENMISGRSAVYVGITNPPDTVKVWGSKIVEVSTNFDDAVINASSSNNGVAVVSVSGKSVTVTGISPGISVITVTVDKEGYPQGSATFMVSSPVYNVRRDSYFDSIQGAIDYAYSGDTIKIARGVYYEHLEMKANNLKLLGEDRDNTIIDASQSGGTTRAGVKIKDFSGIEMRNLTVRNAGLNTTGEAKREPYGIFIWNSDQNVFNNVSLKSNGSYEIYLLDGCNNNLVLNCIIDGAGAGRDGYRSLDGIFSCGGESRDGNRGLINSGNRFIGNVICNVVYGISVTASDNSYITSNEIHALDSSYWKGHTSAGIILSNSSSNIIQNNIIDSSQYGIRLSTLSVYSPYAYAGSPGSNVISRNTLSNMQFGVRIVGSDNILQDNDINKNSDTGVWLTDSAWGTNVLGNTVKDNGIGILVDNVLNTIRQNKITGGTYVIKNTVDAELDATGNSWGDSGSVGRIFGRVRCN